MIRISADTLEDAYKKAAKELGVSIIDLDIEVLQNPSSGFLGMFSKQAIIKATIKDGDSDYQGSETIVQKNQKTKIKKEKKEPKLEEELTDQNRVKYEIKEGMNRLLDASCFNVNLVELRIDEESVYMKLDGDDVGLLIGKEGYRYKALSYALHNWIKIKYNLSISLEIAEFLKNQEEMIESYLIGIKERVDLHGKAQTKPLDGILVKIALTSLRAAYPDKYVAIRTLRDKRKIIVVNNFRKSDT